jgi:hypothetical protein
LKLNDPKNLLSLDDLLKELQNFSLLPKKLLLVLNYSSLEFVKSSSFFLKKKKKKNISQAKIKKN